MPKLNMSLNHNLSQDEALCADIKGLLEDIKGKVWWQNQ